MDDPGGRRDGKMSVTALAERPIAERLSARVEELPFSARIRTACKRYNMRTLGDLAQRTRAELFSMSPMGRKSVDEIESMVVVLGLELGRPVSDYDGRMPIENEVHPPENVPANLEAIATLLERLCVAVEDVIAEWKRDVPRRIRLTAEDVQTLVDELEKQGMVLRPDPGEGPWDDDEK